MMAEPKNSITLWAVGKKDGGFFLQNGYPFLCDTKKAAQVWCDKDEKPVRVSIEIQTSQKRGM